MHQIRLLWMDILNITASICVILLHCNHHVKYLYEGKEFKPFSIREKQ